MTKQNTNIIRKGNTCIPFIPLNEKVAVEVSLKKPSIIIEDANQLQVLSCKVCGYGANVHNINLGDEVIIDENPTLKHPLLFRWNYDESGKIKETEEGIIRNYFVVRAQDIIGIVK
jgi:hypothetical protein